MNRTIVSFLLDRSGSMADGIAVTIGSFNSYIEGLQAEKDAEILLNLVAFSSVGTERLCSAAPIASAPKLSTANYHPAGGTPLIDAAVKMIHAVDKQVAEQPGAKVVMVIQTDGEENASTQYGSADLHALIKARTDAGWQFIFMGADIDAYGMAARYGISAAQTIGYGKFDFDEASAAMRATATNTADFSAGRRVDASYLSGQRAQAGDKFWPGGNPGPKPMPERPRAPAVDDIKL